MKKRDRVKKSSEFERIIKENRLLKNKEFVIYYSYNIEKKSHFGISVGKKIGNAVTRNKMKRKIRSIIDNNKNIYQKPLDYIIIIRKNCLILSYEEIEKSFISLLTKLNS